MATYDKTYDDKPIDEILKDLGLPIALDWYTFFTSVIFYPGKTPLKFYKDLYRDYKKIPQEFVKKEEERIRILIVALTFGAADAMIVWQAKDVPAVKAFRDNVLAGNGQRTITATAFMSEGGGRGRGPLSPVKGGRR